MIGKTTLLTNIHSLVPMSGERSNPAPPLHNAAVIVQDNKIAWLGAMEQLHEISAPHETVNLRNHIVLPGLVNTHHHLYQTLTRAVAQDSELFDWLKTLYPFWLKIDAEAVYVSALTGMAELILSGCTTASDHLYIYPNDAKIDDEIRAAHEIGLRFHATRGSMSLGESSGGLPPDKATENEQAILKDTVRAVERYHDASRYAMLRIAAAPCSPFSVTGNLMRESAALAREYGIMLHTHLAETRDEEAYCLAKFGKRPLDYAESVNWLGEDVWYAHGVHFNRADIERMAGCGCGVAHCPTSNMRLASGIAPVRLMLDSGMKVGLGVDGSASNDGSHLLGEVRQSMLLQRVQNGASAFSAYDALWVGTRGGASVLGRDDIGQIAPGYAADLIAIDLNRLEYTGALHDPMAAVVLCAPRGVDFSMINGRVIVHEGQINSIDIGRVIERHNAISRKVLTD
ncbi:MAG: 8-oxoguanine deaminase [Chloroflexi bacterium]|nr:8-oxoguanine deaminase [Chloroflexota bacterium]MCL5273701.1 8-oxoguanine deaminase [Chloroflexota bacterium]